MPLQSCDDPVRRRPIDPANRLCANTSSITTDAYTCPWSSDCCRDFALTFRNRFRHHFRNEGVHWLAIGSKSATRSSLSQAQKVGRLSYRYCKLFVPSSFTSQTFQCLNALVQAMAISNVVRLNAPGKKQRGTIRASRRAAWGRELPQQKKRPRTQE